MPERTDEQRAEHARWMREWRAKHRDEYNAYDRAYRRRNKKKVYKWQRAADGRRDPLKVKARRDLNNALKTGRVQKSLVCEFCGSRDSLTAHHPDYSKPFNVNWLCTSCHRLLHEKTA